jgi:hypothetical protein
MSTTTESPLAARHLSRFDARALFEAIDERRRSEGGSWSTVAAQIWDLSADLNAQRNDHPIAPTTITGMATRGATSCQHALFMLRWLGRSPESFLDPPRPELDRPLPELGRDRRLRWNLRRTYDALNECRVQRGRSWSDLAETLRCTPSQLTGVRTARFAMDMNLAMKITQWIGRPAAEFIDPAPW